MWSLAQEDFESKIDFFYPLSKEWTRKKYYIKENVKENYKFIQLHGLNIQLNLTDHFSGRAKKIARLGGGGDKNNRSYI